ncbi:MAG: hypothetical protein JSS81_27695 [Acidobacteria bacterium]|nr:hypothetical protein [Acidobacteriota bacterium]
MGTNFGESKANETPAWQNNRELNPQENSAVTDDAVEPEDKQGDTTWRPTDDKAETGTNLDRIERREEHS